MQPKDTDRVTHYSDTGQSRPTWQEQDDGWAVLFGLIPWFKGLSGDWDVIDDLVEREEFGGLWWW
ncbi:MAG: hypothetical protein AAF618_10710 [Pseudomonadota bacterium]